MTLSTSAVAVCCSSDCRNSLSSRVFSMAMTAWAAKFLSNSICLSVKWPHLLPVNADGADQLAFLEHRNKNERVRGTRHKL